MGGLVQVKKKGEKTARRLEEIEGVVEVWGAWGVIKPQAAGRQKECGER